MRYTITSPAKESAIMEAHQDEVASIATMLMGDGYFMLSNDETDFIMPPVAEVPGEFYRKFQYGVTESFLKMDREELRRCLRSVTMEPTNGNVTDFVGIANQIADALKPQEGDPDE